VSLATKRGRLILWIAGAVYHCESGIAIAAVGGVSPFSFV